MQPLCFAVLGATLATGAIAAPITPLERETAVWNAVKSKDMDAFAASMSDDFVGLYSDGMHDRSRELRIVREQTLHRFSISNFRARQIGPDGMLLTYAADVKVDADGKDYSGRYWNTTVWQRRGGKWFTVYHGEAKAK